MKTASERRYEVAVVTSGVGRPSNTRFLAEHLAKTVAVRGRTPGDRIATEIYELRDVGADLGQSLVTGAPSAALQDLIAAATGADGMIILTPILNSSYSGLLKMFVDLLPFGALQGKPVLIAATGGSARHGLCLDFTLRPLLAYLKADVISSSVYVTGTDLAGERFAARVEAAAGELVAKLRAGDPAIVS